MYLDFHAHCNSGDPGEVLAYVKACEKNHTIAALSGGLHYGGHDFLPNEEVVKICRQYPENLVPLAKIDLWDTPPDPAQLHYYADMGVKGFKFIYPYYGYDHDLYMPIFEELEKMDMPALFHTGEYRPNSADILYRRPMLENMSPLRLDRIARSFQKLNIVMAHLGTSYFREVAAELVKTHANIYFDLAGGGAFLGVSPKELAELLRPRVYMRETKEDSYFRKMVLGSDSYINIPIIQEEAISAYLNLLLINRITPEEKEAIMGGTVAKWLGIQL